jgi:hypothetical protein
VKGRAALRTALRAQAAAWFMVPLALLPEPRWFYLALHWGGSVTGLTSTLTIGVILLWNMLGSREDEAPALPACCQKAAGPSPAQAARMIREARAAGTLSVNGLRYLGPPPVETGPHKVLRAPLVTKSECDECGAPLDVARCNPGWHYLCPRCRASQVFRPY